MLQDLLLHLCDGVTVQHFYRNCLRLIWASTGYQDIQCLKTQIQNRVMYYNVIYSSEIVAWL